MKRTLQTNIAWALGIAFLLSLGVAAPAWSHDKQSGLDGVSYEVDVRPDKTAKDKGEKSFHETITFADGKLMTANGARTGFESAKYTLTQIDDHDYTFNAEQDGDDHGKQVWSGTVKGDDIRGKMVWTKADGTVLTYDFHGDEKRK